MKNLETARTTSTIARGTPAPRTGPQNGSFADSGSSLRGVSTDAGVYSFHASSFVGALGPQPAALTSSIPGNLSYSAQRQTHLLMADEPCAVSWCSSRSSRDAGPGPTACGPLHAGVKRARALAFLADAASTQADPPGPSVTQLRWLQSLPTSLGGDSEDGAHRSSSPVPAQGWQAARFQRAPAERQQPGARELLPHEKALDDLLIAAAADAATKCSGAAASTGACPSTSIAAAAAAAPSSTCHDLARPSGSVSLLLPHIATASAGLEQSLATARAVMPAPTQIGKQRAAAAAAAAAASAATASSSIPTAGVAPNASGPCGSNEDQLSRDAKRSEAAVAEPFLCLCQVASNGASQAHHLSNGALGPRNPSSMPARGNDRRSHDHRGKGSMPGNTPAGRLPETLGRTECAGEVGGCAAAVMTGTGVGLKMERGTAGPAGPVSASLPLEASDVVAPAATESHVEQQGAGGATGAPVAAAAPMAAPPPDPPPPPQRPGPIPIIAGLGAALPREFAARLKKPVRIIQPISKAWVEETLQGAAAAGGSGGGNGALPAAAVSAAFAGSRPRYPGGACWGSSTGGVRAGVVPAAQLKALMPVALPSEQQPCALGELSLREVPPLPVAAAPAAAQAPASSSVPLLPASVPQNPKTPEGGAAAADPAAQMALAPSLALLASLPLGDGASPFSLSCLGGLPLPQVAQGPAGSACGAVLPPQSFESINTSTVTPTTGMPSPFSSGLLPPPSGSGASQPGPSGASAAAPPAVAAGTVSADRTCATAADGGTTVMLPGLGAVAALLAGAAFAGPVHPAAAAASAGGKVVARGYPNPQVVLRRPCNALGSIVTQPRGAAGLLRPLQEQVRPLAASPVSAESSAPCLGKVQGELTLLYQWYLANKTVYLEQAQRQLRRLEALTAVRDGGSGGGIAGGDADAAAAAAVKTESAEALRAFETALKIMTACGRVEQQWLAAPPAPVSTPNLLAAAAVAGTDRGQGQTPDPAAAVGPAGVIQPHMAPGGLQFPANVSPLLNGCSHGAGAALAVAAALVGSMALGPSPTLAPGPGPRGGGPGEFGAATGGGGSECGAAPPGGAGMRPLAAELPPSWGPHRLVQTEDARPPTSVAVLPPPSSLSLRPNAAGLSPGVAPLGQPTRA